MRWTHFFLVLLIISQIVFAYRDYSFSLKVIADGQGNAHVVQKSVFLLENDTERNVFDAYLSRAQFTLEDWQRFSNKIIYYFNGDVSNLTITATREPAAGFNAAAVSLEYDVGKLFLKTPKSSRGSLYSLDLARTIFFISNKGELVLGNHIELTFVLPQDAFSIKTIPEPSSRSSNELLWKGPLKGKFALSYEEEKPLTVEVNEFFLQLYQEIGNLYLLALLLALGGFLAFKYLNSRRRE